MGLLRKSADDWNQEGLEWTKKGRYEVAIDCYNMAIQINSKHADAWNNKGLALDSLGDYVKAVSCYQEAVKINPNHAKAWNNKGITHRKLGQFKEAIECYNRAIAIPWIPTHAQKNKEYAMPFLAEQLSREREQETRIRIRREEEERAERERLRKEREQAEKERLRKEMEERAENERIRREEKERAEKARLTAIEQLSSAISVIMPEFMDQSTAAQVTLLFHNNTDREFRDIKVDTSDVSNFFAVEGEIIIPLLRPRMELERRLKILPNEEKGVFPVKIVISCGGVAVEKEYTIKVGGTEIY